MKQKESGAGSTPAPGYQIHIMKPNIFALATGLIATICSALASEITQFNTIAVIDNNYGDQSINTADTSRAALIGSGPAISQVARGHIADNSVGSMEINDVIVIGFATSPIIVETYDVVHTKCRVSALTVNSVKATGYFTGGATLSYSGYSLSATLLPITINSYVY